MRRSKHRPQLHRWRPRRSKWGKAFKRNRTYLDAYTREIILRDMAEMGGKASADALMRHAPGRYDPRYLGGALKQMKAKSYIYYTGARGWGRRSPVYETRERHDREMAEWRARNAA